MLDSVDYRKKVRKIMEEKNPYGLYHHQNFENFATYGDSMPINSDIINDIPDNNAKIILSDKVYNFLLVVQDVTKEEGKEIPFYLYGEEIDNNIIFFNDYKYDSGGNNVRQETEAEFTKEMNDDLIIKLNNNLNNGFVVCHGHSHPKIGNFHQNFSLGDFVAYIQMNQENKAFKDKQVDLMGCLVTCTGDINFVFYDNFVDNFYRFTNVYVARENGGLNKINCYGLKQAEHNQASTISSRQTQIDIER